MLVRTDTQDPFASFFDPIDMVMSCSMDTTLAEINRLAAEQHLRFPLVCDPSQTIGRHLAAIEYAPQSARFGPYVDNVLGMNWELKSGRVVRIGERVIKSTTGYDLQRFLLHSDDRYGRAVDYVLRLRPFGGEAAECSLTGEDAAIERACQALLKSVWIHWLDAIDLCISGDHRMTLELTADCVPGESAVFQNFFRKIGCDSGTEVTLSKSANEMRLPRLTFKTTVIAAGGLARRLVAKYGGTARVLCVNGVVYYFPPVEQDTFPADWMKEWARQCIAEGGHIYGPWAGTPVAGAREITWARELETKWGQL